MSFRRLFICLYVVLFTILNMSCKDRVENFKIENIKSIEVVFEQKTSNHVVYERKEIAGFLKCFNFKELEFSQPLTHFSKDGTIRMITNDDAIIVFEFDLEKGIRILSNEKWLYYTFNYCSHRYLLEI